MLDASDLHRCRTGIYIVLLHGVAASEGEKSGCRSIIGDARDPRDRGHDLVCDLLSSDVPSSGLSGGLVSLKMSTLFAHHKDHKAKLPSLPFSILYNTPIFRPCKPARPRL